MKLPLLRLKKSSSSTSFQYTALYYTPIDKVQMYYNIIMKNYLLLYP